MTYRPDIKGAAILPYAVSVVNIKDLSEGIAFKYSACDDIHATAFRVLDYFNALVYKMGSVNRGLPVFNAVTVHNDTVRIPDKDDNSISDEAKAAAYERSVVAMPDHLVSHWRRINELCVQHGEVCDPALRTGAPLTDMQNEEADYYRAEVVEEVCKFLDAIRQICIEYENGGKAK